MQRWNRWAGPALALLLASSGLVQAEPDRKPPRETASFGLYRQTDAETARTQAQAWLKSVGKTDAATQKSFDALWASDKALLEKVSGTLELGDPRAARLLAAAADPESPAPTEVPNLIKDTKLPAFYRANLGLAYGKALASRRVFEEALDALKSVKVDDVVDPASYFFHRAVCEHGLLLRADAADSIDRLVNDVAEGPDRYRVVASLMLDDMLSWTDKGLDEIARKMSVIKDRLDLTRGGPKTRRMQREVLVKLDEKIKELENKAKSGGS